jgi:hypothetical protein
MHSVVVFVIAFVCLFGGARIGMIARRMLPEHHLKGDSTDVIKLATGLLATLVALVLSLLVSSANTFHATMENEYKQALAAILQIDQNLRAYGPEAKDVRQHLRRSVAEGLRRRWPQEDFGPAEAPTDSNVVPTIDLEERILALNPTEPRQKWFQAQALQLAHELARIRQLISGDASGQSLPVPLVILLLAAGTAIFASFGLLVRPNPTVVAALAMAAVAVSGALFVIVEFNSPFTGLLQLSSEPARVTYAQLGT